MGAASLASMIPGVLSTVEMGRLEAPARDKPGIYQHQRRELRRSVATIAGYIQKRSADGRYMAGTAGV